VKREQKPVVKKARPRHNWQPLLRYNYHIHLAMVGRLYA